MTLQQRVFLKYLPVLLVVMTAGFFHSDSVAKSVFDPFIQEFQVGVHSNPDKVELAWGYPANLLHPAKINTPWTSAGLNILSAQPSSQSPHLSLRLLKAMGSDEDASSWAKWHRLRIQQLVAWQDTLVTQGRYLLAERLTMGFFRALEHKQLTEARQLANRLASNGHKMGLPGRDIFIWKLRVRLLDRMLKKKTDPNKIFWRSTLKLGTYDMGNAWALWTAHRRLNNYPAIPSSLKTKDNARRLSVLRKSWISRDDIQNSAFSHDVKAGLGARLLKKQELNKHLSIYPEPPVDFMLQGWWVSGQRKSRIGQTDYYEALAQRKGLKPGWRLDLLRRASEVHLLNGRWDEGLKDLGLALDKAEQGAGTASQRRRLRQWTEQALVLALATNDTLRANEILSLARKKFSGEQKTVFQKETRNWGLELGQEISEYTPSSDFKDKCQRKVETGLSGLLKPVTQDRQNEFQVSSATPLWSLWARWGLSLVPEEKAGRNLYREILNQIETTSDPDIQANLVVSAVALIMKSRLEQEPLLRWALDKDIHHSSAGQSLTAMTPIPALAKKHKGDSTALHALLGIALLADDMRGIVGVATPMSQGCLTKREKLCFLYPLPSTGSIHEALTTSANDPALLLAVARNESLFEPSVRSHAGALGWMQIMPFHFRDKGAAPGADNWSCASVSIGKGDALLAENRKRYAGNPYLTVAAYNAGPGAVKRWQKQLRGCTRDDIFLAWIGYPETRHYVQKVLTDREIYHWIISESRLDY